MRPAGLEPATPGLGNRSLSCGATGRERNSILSQLTPQPRIDSGPRSAVRRTPASLGSPGSTRAARTELAELRGLPYSVWRDFVGHSMCNTVTRARRAHLSVRIIPSWVKEGSQTSASRFAHRDGRRFTAGCCGKASSVRLITNSVIVRSILAARRGCFAGSFARPLSDTVQSGMRARRPAADLA